MNRFLPTSLNRALKTFSHAAMCGVLVLALGACAERTNNQGAGMEQQDTLGAAQPTDTTGMTQQQQGQNQNSVVQVAMDDEQFSSFSQALQNSGLASSLKNQGPYTVFAPTNEAFDALPDQQRQQLTNTQNKQKLRNVLTYHVVEGEINVSDLQNKSNLTTMQGETIKVSQQGENLMVGNAQIVEEDIQAGNGVVHGIDAVLMPQQQGQQGGMTGGQSSR